MIRTRIMMIRDAQGSTRMPDGDWLLSSPRDGSLRGVAKAMTSRTCWLTACLLTAGGLSLHTKLRKVLPFEHTLFCLRTLRELKLLRFFSDTCQNENVSAVFAVFRTAAVLTLLLRSYRS